MTWMCQQQSRCVVYPERTTQPKLETRNQAFLKVGYHNEILPIKSPSNATHKQSDLAANFTIPNFKHLYRDPLIILEEGY